MWTAKLRQLLLKALPPERLLPDSQPEYVATWIYTFGVLTLSSLFVVLLSGAVIGLGGPLWWHTSKVGLFFNSLHLWGTELFFFFMVIHLWAKFFMAAWRGGRSLTWISGVLTFLISIGTAFTGYLSQTNFDSQWISSRAKDGLNAAGVGAFFQILNFGQMFVFHILLLPVALIVLVGLHVLLVRYKGVVPPIGVQDASDH